MITLDPDLRREITLARMTLERAGAALAEIDGRLSDRPICILTDKAGRSFYLMERENSWVFYYTKEGDEGRYILWDSMYEHETE